MATRKTLFENHTSGAGTYSLYLCDEGQETEGWTLHVGGPEPLTFGDLEAIGWDCLGLDDRQETEIYWTNREAEVSETISRMIDAEESAADSSFADRNNAQPNIPGYGNLFSARPVIRV